MEPASEEQKKKTVYLEWKILDFENYKDSEGEEMFWSVFRENSLF